MFIGIIYIKRVIPELGDRPICFNTAYGGKYKRSHESRVTSTGKSRISLKNHSWLVVGGS